MKFINRCELCPFNKDGEEYCEDCLNPCCKIWKDCYVCLSMTMNVDDDEGCIYRSVNVDRKCGFVAYCENCTNCKHIIGGKNLSDYNLYDLIDDIKKVVSIGNLWNMYRDNKIISAYDYDFIYESAVTSKTLVKEMIKEGCDKTWFPKEIVSELNL